MTTPPAKNLPSTYATTPAPTLPTLGASVKGIDEAMASSPYAKVRALFLYFHQSVRPQSFTAEQLPEVQARIALLNIDAKSPAHSTPASKLEAADAFIYANPHLWPQTYTIYYHVVDSPRKAKQINQDKALAYTGLKSGVTTDVSAVSPTMEMDIRNAFATLEAQLPGRFRFVATDNPHQADMTFAGTDTLPPEAGPDTRAFTINNKKIGILHAVSESSGTPLRAHTLLHEIGHALGLDHPYEEAAPKMGVVPRTLADTVMLPGVGSLNPQGKPDGAVSYLPSDLKALIALYPIAADVPNGAMIGIPDGPYAHMSPSSHPRFAMCDNTRTMRTLLFAKEGLAFMPMPDTPHDTLIWQRNNTVPGASTYDERDDILKSFPHVFRVRVGDGRTYVPVSVEDIRELAPSQPFDCRSIATGTHLAPGGPASPSGQRPSTKTRP